MGKIKYTEETKTKVIELRLQGMARNQISIELGITPAAVKNILIAANVTIPAEQRQANSLAAKPTDAMAKMRQHITTEHRKLVGEKNRVTYQDPALKALKSKQSQNWWAGLSETDKAFYLAKRQVSIENSQAVKAYRNNINGTDNPKSKSTLKRLGFTDPEAWMDSLAKDRDGKYLGGFVSTMEKCKWKCSQGHEFEKRPGTILYNNQWCPDCTNKITKPHQEIIDYIKTLVDESEIVPNNRGALDGRMELDIHLPKYKFAIEYNGLIWHSDCFGDEANGRHYKKANLCRKAGISLLAVFGDEWNTHQDLIKSMIRWRLNKFDGTYLNARDLVLTRFTPKEYAGFFERNHLEGNVKSSYGLGFRHQDRIVMCASFRTNFNGELEIARMATDYDFCVRGGASKILSNVTGAVVSFSNNRLSIGNVYEQLGFAKVDRKEQPSYWYTDGHTRIWRFRCKRDNTPSILAEYPTEKLQARGGVFSKKLFGDDRPLYRIEDYGSIKWVRPALDPTQELR
jgi:predicted transcriptional regulator